MCLAPEGQTTIKGGAAFVVKTRVLGTTRPSSIRSGSKAKGGDFFISDWLRNRNTVEYLGVWESVFNPAFNYGEFVIIKSQAGLNSYKISVKEWVAKTNAIGLRASAGRYGRLEKPFDVQQGFTCCFSI